MKLILISIVLCGAIFVASGRKLLASTSRQLDRRETDLFKRLVKRQLYNDRNCNPRDCAIPNCGKDFVAATLPGECCERCVPWEYAASLGIRHPVPRPQPQPQTDPRDQQRYDPYSQRDRADVYIYGPDDGARVSAGQSIYFDCEVNAPYQHHAQPRWSRGSNQPLPHKVQSTILQGNRKIARLTIPDATYSDGGRYECSGGTGNPSDQASIDLQVTEGGYHPRPQPQPHYPNYDPYNQYPYNQPGYHPPQPQPQPPHPQPHPQPQPQPAGEGEDEGEDAGGDEEQEPETNPTAPEKQTTTPAPQAPEEGGEDEGEYPEDYTDNEK